MAWRLKASKFKNTMPIAAKREDCIYDLNIGQLAVNNNAVYCGNSRIAFHMEGDGGKLGILPHTARGRHTRNEVEVLCAHGDTVNDFAFMPFGDDDCLVTASRDETCKIWKWPSTGLPRCESTIHVPSSGNGIECVKPHTTANNLCALSWGANVGLADLKAEKVAITMDDVVLEKILSIDVSHDGVSLLVTGDKARQCALLDPRHQGTSTFFTTHGGMGKECRAIFLGDSGKLITSGFTARRSQEVRVFDIRQPTTALATHEFEATTGVLMPLYDADTKLLWLAGKGGTKLYLRELTDNADVLGAVATSELPLSEQTLGACLSPKTHMDVMKGEVQRVWQLTRNGLNPFSCIVPRRSYRDFVHELYPSCLGTVPGCDVDEWLKEDNKMPPRFSLDPVNAKDMNIKPATENAAPTNGSSISNGSKFFSNGATNGSNGTTSGLNGSQNGSNGTSNGSDQVTPKALRPTPKSVMETPFYTPPEQPLLNARAALRETTTPKRPSENEDNQSTINQNTRSSFDSKISKTSGDSKPAEKIEKPGVTLRSTKMMRERPKTTSVIAGMQLSKYRHVESKWDVRDGFTNVRKLNKRLPLETNGFCCSSIYAAIPIEGPGGLIQILQLDAGAKLPEGVIVGVENASNVMDLKWSPHDPSVLAVACDNGDVNIWRISEGGIEETRTTPDKLSSDKVLLLSWHPTASNIMAVATHGGRLNVWRVDQDEGQMAIQLEGHTENILAMTWDTVGNRLTTVCRDKTIRVFEPRTSTQAVLVKEGALESTRAARVLYVCDDGLLCVVGYSRGSARQVTLFDATTLDARHTHQVDTSSQLLTAHYDYDTCVLWLQGKGDTTIHMFELVTDSPWLLPLANCKSLQGGCQSMSLMPKTMCDARSVEFAQCWRAADKTIDRCHFRVPRVKKDVYHSDVLPHALVKWQPHVTAEEWLNGAKVVLKFESLKPDDLEDLPSSKENAQPTRPQSEMPPKAEAKVETAALRVSGQEGDWQIVDKTMDSPKKDVKLEQNIDKSLENQMSSAITEISRKLSAGLEQDSMEGVADESWTDADD